MSQVALYRGQGAESVWVGDNGATFTNIGPDIVYYGDQNVSSTVNTGSIGVGSSVSLTGSPYLILAPTATRAYVNVAANPSTGGSGNGLPSTVVTKTANYTAATGELIEADATSAGFTVTLPAAPATGALVAVKKIDATLNTVTIAPSGGGTIDGQANATTQTQYAGAVFEHTGSNVWVIAASMSTTGPTGPTGPTGATGPAGPTGPPGSASTSWYGDGSDGTATADGSAALAGASLTSGVYTLGRNVYFNNLTVNSGVRIYTNGWLLSVKGTLTNNGTIDNNGRLGGIGATAATTLFPATEGSGTGNIGGGTSATQVFLGYGRAGGLANGTAGTGSTQSLGGAGGAGGSASGGGSAGGAGGTITAVPTQNDSTRLVQYATIGMGQGVTIYGGGGGGGAANDGSVQGGGGGGGGGVIVVNATLLVNNGVIQARGARGADAAGGNSGGGGGGGGGVLFINTTGYSGTGSYDANGGAGGAKGGTGVAGTAGLAGIARLNVWG